MRLFPSPLPSPSHANPSFHSTLLPFSLRVIYALPSVRPHISDGGKERKERVSGGLQGVINNPRCYKKRGSCAHSPMRRPVATWQIQRVLCTTALLCTTIFAQRLFLAAWVERERERAWAALLFARSLGRTKIDQKNLFLCDLVHTKF